MRFLARPVLLLLLMTVAACAAGYEGMSRSFNGKEARLRFKTVLIAGDASIAVFDRATAAVRDRLNARGATVDVVRFTSHPAVAAREGAVMASLDSVLGTIGQLRPGRGQGCLVYATSHGAFEQGLVFAASREFLTPNALDVALRLGCGDAPTVVVISGCFSGTFVEPPMRRPNRIVLTAARADRTSFGCGAEFDYTVYDKCFLRALDEAETWREAHTMIQGCVARREQEQGFSPPSGPRAWLGPEVAGLPMPGQ